MKRASRIIRTLALAAGVLVTLIPAIPAQAAVVYEIYYVPTVDGATIRVEIQRDTKFDADKQPVILTYSPYNTLSETQPAADAGSGGVPSLSKGYARAVADVLGTRGSTGCWDYGGLKEQQSGVDVVKFLAGKIEGHKDTRTGPMTTLTWSNGNVGMTGTSYDGTTANMVAATGIPELKAIMPIAAINHWYGYAYYDGVRYAGNSKVASDEGLDTPLLFDYGLNRTVPADDPGLAPSRVNPACEQESLAHTQQGYSRSPNYSQFWKERDYRKDVDKFRAAVLVVHGWQDYNVKQDEGLSLFESLPVDDPETTDVTEGVPFKMMVLSQQPHSGAPGNFSSIYDRFWAQTLKGKDTDVELEPQVQTLGRTANGADPGYTPETSWPPQGTKDVSLYFGRSFVCVPGVPCGAAGPVGTTGENGILSQTKQNSGAGWAYVNNGTATEELTLEDPTNRVITTQNGQPVQGHGYISLFHESPPLAQDTRLAGRAILDAYVNVLTPGQTLTPLLVEVQPNGNLVLVERGFLNLDYRDGLEQAKATTGNLHGRVSFLPQDYTFKAGSRIGVILQGSNTVWAIPGNPGMTSYAMGPVNGFTDTGTSLVLPLVGAPDNLFA